MKKYRPGLIVSLPGGILLYIAFINIFIKIGLI